VAVTRPNNQQIAREQLKAWDFLEQDTNIFQSVYNIKK